MKFTGRQEWWPSAAPFIFPKRIGTVTAFRSERIRLWAGRTDQPLIDYVGFAAKGRAARRASRLAGPGRETVAIHKRLTLDLAASKKAEQQTLGQEAGSPFQ